MGAGAWIGGMSNIYESVALSPVNTVIRVNTRARENQQGVKLYNSSENRNLPYLFRPYFNDWYSMFGVMNHFAISAHTNYSPSDARSVIARFVQPHLLITLITHDVIGVMTLMTLSSLLT